MYEQERASDSKQEISVEYSTEQYAKIPHIARLLKFVEKYTRKLWLVYLCVCGAARGRRRCDYAVARYVINTRTRILCGFFAHFLCAIVHVGRKKCESLYHYQHSIEMYIFSHVHTCTNLASSSSLPIATYYLPDSLTLSIFFAKII